MMDNTREKLIELEREATDHASDICIDHRDCEDCPSRKYGTHCRDYIKADHLISNGVTVLPCNVGQKIWMVYTPKHPANPNDKGKWFMAQDGVQRIIYGVKGWSVETWNMGTIPAKEIGRKLFFTKEEAETALPQPPKGE